MRKLWRALVVASVLSVFALTVTGLYAQGQRDYGDSMMDHCSKMMMSTMGSKSGPPNKLWQREVPKTRINKV